MADGVARILCGSRTEVFAVSQLGGAVILNYLENSLSIQESNFSHLKPLQVHWQIQHVYVCNFHHPTGELRPAGGAAVPGPGRKSAGCRGSRRTAEAGGGCSRRLRALSALVPRFTNRPVKLYLSPGLEYSTSRIRLYGSSWQY